MDVHMRGCSSGTGSEEEMELRRGPWTIEEDLILINYIANHGEGRWNSLARCAGLKRTGKSCRLRWLNYLRPDVRRGNITLEEQLLILELHTRWGNRWSKIAQQLPGRTDNEIKNYWRTRVQKHAKQLKCDVNSKQFRDVMQYLWMPRLAERIRASAASGSATTTTHQNMTADQAVPPSSDFGVAQVKPDISPAHSSTINTQVVSPVSDLTDYYFHGNDTAFQTAQIPSPESLPSYFNHGFELPASDQNGWFGGGISEIPWNMDDVWFLQQ